MEKKDKNDNLNITEKDLKFDKKDSIGSGAFGEVFLATLIKTNERVAVKKVFQDRRYKNRELSIMKELNHPNLVYLKSYYYTESLEHANEYYLNVVMDYVPQTLSKMISHNRAFSEKFPDILLKLYSYQMLKAIGYLHSLGICHRDIKPDITKIRNNKIHLIVKRITKVNADIDEINAISDKIKNLLN